jgi:hypothetical protein
MRPLHVHITQQNQNRERFQKFGMFLVALLARCTAFAGASRESL